MHGAYNVEFLRDVALSSQAECGHNLGVVFCETFEHNAWLAYSFQMFQPNVQLLVSTYMRYVSATCFGTRVPSSGRTICPVSWKRNVIWSCCMWVPFLFFFINFVAKMNVLLKVQIYRFFIPCTYFFKSVSLCLLCRTYIYKKSWYRKRKCTDNSFAWHLVLKNLAYCSSRRWYTSTETCSRNLSNISTDYKLCICLE
jgi:hypothetical protein